MLLDRSFFVRAGDLIRVGPWNLAGKAIRAMHLISGIGVRLRSTPDGTFINFDGSKAIFDHPFKVSLIGNSACTVRPGRINGVKGKIGDKELEYVEGEPVPQLDFKTPKLDKDGRGWIAAEVTCSQKDWAVESWKIVQVGDLDTDAGMPAKDGSSSGSSLGGVPNLPGRRCRQPLAMLRLQGSTGLLKVYQVTFFNLQHRVRMNHKDPKADAGRHFFWPKG